MATPIGFALNKIRQMIPKEVLNLVFTPTAIRGMKRYAHNASTIDAQIKEKVIDGWVRMDTDSIGAKEVSIPIGDLSREYTDRQGWVVRIPRERLNGRTIVQALSVAISPYGVMGSMVGMNTLGRGSLTSNSCGSSSWTTVATDIMNAAAPIELNQTAHISLIGENTIFVEDALPYQNLTLRCMVSTDDEFTFLQAPSFRIFAELCVWACKAYIYNNYAITLDEGYIRGGADLGKIKDIIDGYSDAADNYNTLLKEDWGAVVAMNDPQRHQRYIRGITGARWR